MNLGFIELGQQDYRRLRRELLALSVIFGGLLLFYGAFFYLSGFLGERLQLAQSAQTQAASQLAQVETELQDIKHFTPLYQQLADRGVMGEEKRLEWVELLERLQQETGLPAVQYRFSPRADVTQPPIPLTLNAHKLLSSPLELTLHALHEEQVIRYLQRMEAQGQGLPLLKQCELSKSGGTKYPAKLTALCQYQWYTLQPSATPEGTP